ncbi:MAG TPA: TlpA disulfide reductase family protein [Ancylobacter sp.]
MSAFSLGPFVFAGDRLAAIVGIFTFLLVATFLDRRFVPGLGRAAWWGLLAGLVGARFGHVVQHWGSFSQGPMRAMAFWQGGFAPLPGAVLASAAGAVAIRSWRAAAALVVSAALGLLFWAGTSELTRATLGKAAPTIALAQLDGQPLAISDLRGRPSVVNLWATWCPPCRREMPLLARVSAENPEAAFVFVNQAEGPDRIRTYLKEEELRLGHVLLDPALEVQRHYAAVGIPLTLFLRADGTLAGLHVGEISPELLQAGLDAAAAR